MSKAIVQKGLKLANKKLKATKVCFAQHQNPEKAPKGNDEEVLQEKNTDHLASERRGQRFAFLRRWSNWWPSSATAITLWDWVLHIITLGKWFCF